MEVTRLLPTPPLPLTMPMTFLILEYSFAGAKRLSSFLSAQLAPQAEQLPSQDSLIACIVLSVWCRHAVSEPAAAASACGASVLAIVHVAAADDKFAALNNAKCQLFAGAGIDGLHRCAGNAHLLGTLLLGQLLKVNEPDDFVLIDRHGNLTLASVLRPEKSAGWT
jgi:hypothetical protein